MASATAMTHSTGPPGAAHPSADVKTYLKGNARQHSCATCHQRKVKCDKNNPCSYCAARGLSCVPMIRSIPRPRKKRFPEAELLARLRRYEAALKSYGADIEQINAGMEMKESQSPVPTTEPTGHATPMAKPAEQDPIRGASSPKSWHNHTNDVEETEQMLRGASDDEDGIGNGPIFTTYDRAFVPDGSPIPNNAGFDGKPLDLPSIHPTPVQIFQLWQIYLDNVHPLLKVLHAPTIQQQLFKSVNDLSSIPFEMHALFFAVYSAALLSLRETPCRELLGHDKWTLTNRFNAASRCALKEAGFLRSSSILTHQALVLSVISLTKTMDPRSLLCMTAVAERSARRNGYHLNSRSQHVSPFDSEMKRRLWWQLVAQQGRAAETAAAGPSALCFDWCTNLPLNINENDLEPGMEALPSEHELPTDMIFCLVRYEIANFLRRVWLEVQRKVPEFNGSEFGNPHMTLGDKLREIESLEQRLQDRYLQYCDRHTVLHIMTRYYATFSISKMKIAAYATAGMVDQPTDLTAKERRDTLIRTCLEAIEAYTACFTNKKLGGFLWFLKSSVPFFAYVHLLFNLRYRPSGELADRAWNIVTTETDVYGRPIWIWGLNPTRAEPEDSAMKLAFANLTIRAWEAREAALNGKHRVQVPTLVMKMRERLTAHRNHRDASPIAAGHEETEPLQPGSQGLAMHTGGPKQIPCANQAEEVTSGLYIGDFALQLPMQDLPMDNEISMFDYWSTLLPDNPAGDTGDMEEWI